MFKRSIIIPQAGLAIATQWRLQSTMKSSSPQRPSHRAIGALCVLIVGGMIAPSMARAGCGHNVTSIRTRATQSSIDILQPTSLPGSQSSEPGPGIPERNRPCTGPYCSSREPDLPRAPAGSPVPRSDARSGTIATLAWTDERGDYRPAGVLVVHPRHLTSPLERPPRPPVANAT